MAPAERLRLLEIFARRYEHAAFRLDRFEDESGETPGREPARQFAEVAEGDREEIYKVTADISLAYRRLQHAYLEEL